MESRTFNVLCVTKFISGTAQWHRSDAGPAEIIVSEVNRVPGFECSVVTVKFLGKELPLVEVRPGLDGSCVALVVVLRAWELYRDHCNQVQRLGETWVLYTDIPMEGRSEEDVRRIAERTINSRAPRW